MQKEIKLSCIVKAQLEEWKLYRKGTTLKIELCRKCTTLKIELYRKGTTGRMEVVS
ncbi:hypothetical protein FM107_16750 [Sphingobacterium sp. JB170]|nr:hypothetical protein FM107_16750 [Sphingobacterium sp. JB170]